MAIHLLSKARAHRTSRCILFLALSCLIICFTGCANSCFVFNSNPPTGTLNIKISDPAPTCTAATSTGAVRLLAHTVSQCTSCSGADQVQHIFVSLRGVTLREGASVPVGADDVSSNWQELLPQLGSQPLQVDLMNPPGDLSIQQALGPAHAIPPGNYRQLRLRFVPNQASSSDALPEKNACGMGFNCIVLKDGRALPLEFDGVVPELSIPSSSLAGGSLLVLPDTTTNLVLDFRMSWILVHSEVEGLHLVPTLRTTASLGSLE